MTNIDIRINLKSLSDHSGLIWKDINKKTFSQIVESFSYYIEYLYASMIREAIYSKRYKGKWEPTTTKEYIEYIGVAPKGDIITKIERALEVKRRGSDFIVRVNPNIKYQESKISLVKVLRSIEYGTSKFNARPILRSIIKKINSSIYALWRGFLKKRGVI